MRDRLSRFVSSPLLSPFLLTVFPVVFIWAHNARGVHPIKTVLPVLILTLAVTTVFFLGARLLTKDLRKASLLTCLFVVLSLSFGHVASALHATSALQDGPGTDEETWILAAWGLLAVAGSLVVIGRGGAAPPSLFKGISFVAAALTALNVASIAVTVPTTSGETAAWQVPMQGWSPDRTHRDVYYLIFDRYAEETTLAYQYGFDNAPFLTALQKDGFFVVPRAIANYPQTAHSLASSLNMTYLQDLADRVGVDSSDPRPLDRSLSDITVGHVFQSLGYRYVHVGSWWPDTAVDPEADENVFYGRQGEFPWVFASTTVWPAIASRLGVDAFDFRRQEFGRASFMFDSLKQLAQDPEPTFTFAHFTLPHPPYTMDANGAFVPSPDDRPIQDAYLAQLQATNTKILDLLNTLLAGPPASRPIVIIQSDEGPYPVDQETQFLHLRFTEVPADVLERKMRILNAYYLPGVDPDAVGVTREITPVNTFRVIFDAYFGADLPILPDRSYVFTDDDHPFRFVDVTDELRGG